MNRNFRISFSLIFVFAGFCLALPMAANGQRVKKKKKKPSVTKTTTKTTTTIQSLIVIDQAPVVNRPVARPTRGLGIKDSKFVVPANTLRIALDYDHDGRADYVVFNPATNNWQIIKSSGGTVNT